MSGLTASLMPTYDLVRIYASRQGCLKAQAFGLTNIGVKLKCCKQSRILRILGVVFSYLIYGTWSVFHTVTCVICLSIQKVEAITAITTTAVLFLGNFTSASCYDSVGNSEIQNRIF
ncbi:unnamed protein product [Rodentolepis nana]|uniref:Transmembrane protein n=1 Tax=Rodentolepis nana TaxID=102285 RepID=A0A0R3TJZ7_RODNA|nr:unnamed protein product [Rodentolepis nana]